MDLAREKLSNLEVVGDDFTVIRIEELDFVTQFKDKENNEYYRQKFGGTSVGNLTKIKNVAKRIVGQLKKTIKLSLHFGHGGTRINCCMARVSFSFRTGTRRIIIHRAGFNSLTLWRSELGMTISLTGIKWVY